MAGLGNSMINWHDGRGGVPGETALKVASAWRTSSYSGPEGGECVEVATGWRKSSQSGNQGGLCVEVAAGDPVILARDSKKPDGPVLAFGVSAWGTFVHEVKQGALDLP